MRNRGQHWGQYTAQCVKIVWIDVYSMIRIVKISEYLLPAEDVTVHIGFGGWPGLE